MTTPDLAALANELETTMSDYWQADLADAPQRLTVCVDRAVHALRQPRAALTNTEFKNAVTAASILIRYLYDPDEAGDESLSEALSDARHYARQQNAWNDDWDWYRVQNILNEGVNRVAPKPEQITAAVMSFRDSSQMVGRAIGQDHAVEIVDALNNQALAHAALLTLLGIPETMR
jgi:hypothetical protein